MFAARPAPIPCVLVGVLTEMKITSDSSTKKSTSDEKKRFLPLVRFTTFCPGKGGGVGMVKAFDEAVKS